MRACRVHVGCPHLCSIASTTAGYRQFWCRIKAHAQIAKANVHKVAAMLAPPENVMALAVGEPQFAG